MRIQRSSSPREYRAPSCLWSNLKRSPNRQRIGRTLVATSAVFGLALLIGMGAYLRTWQPGLLGLQSLLDRVPARTNGLSMLRLDLDLQAYQSLAMQRQQALQTGILLPADVHWVPAQVRLEGQIVPVRVRLTGSEPSGSTLSGSPPVDHWAPSKWSLDVEVEGDGQIDSASAFFLISPATRGYLNGWLYAQDLRQAGIPAPSYTFVNLLLNGEDWGIYALETPPPTERSTFDAELRGRFLAHADLWGARLPDLTRAPQVLADQDTPIVGLAFDADPALSDAYAREAARISQPQHLRALERTHRRAFKRTHNALASEFYSAYLTAPWAALAERQRTLSAALHSGAFVRDDPPAPDVLAGLASPLPALDLPPAPSVEEALARYPFLQPACKGAEPLDFLQVRPGTWHVEGDLVLPEGVGLWADEAFTLCFERDAVLLIRGPLALHGPEGGSIRLLPAEDHWGGMVVLGTEGQDQAVLRNVEVRGARGIQRGNWKTHGGVTFVDIPALFHRCRVLDSYAPAAVLPLSGCTASLALPRAICCRSRARKDTLSAARSTTRWALPSVSLTAACMSKT